MALRYRQLSGQDPGLDGRTHADHGVENPQGQIHYIAAAFPSQCGKTNLAMLIPPKSLPGYKVWTLVTTSPGCASAQMGGSGRRTLKPVSLEWPQGLNYQTNYNAMVMVQKNSYFTNVFGRPMRGQFGGRGWTTPPSTGSTGRAMTGHPIQGVRRPSQRPLHQPGR